MIWSGKGSSLQVRGLGFQGKGLWLRIQGPGLRVIRIRLQLWCGIVRQVARVLLDEIQNHFLYHTLDAGGLQ